MKPKDIELISKALIDIDSNNEKLRNKAFNILLPLSETSPKELYSEW